MLANLDTLWTILGVHKFMGKIFLGMQNRLYSDLLEILFQQGAREDLASYCRSSR